MRKRIFIFCVTVMLLTGCSKKTNEIIDGPTAVEQPGNNELIKEEVTKTLVADPSKFHFVADWLTESKVIYVEKVNGHYQVNSFDFESGQTDTLYEDESIIIDLLIHPSKKYLLLHTSDNAASATIKIVTMDGAVQDEVIVASTELAIEWNDTDPSLILLTAFHQDWTFDLFIYNGKVESLDLLAIEDPFPKWLGEDKIAVGYVEGHVLDGGEIHTYEPLTKKWGQLDISGVVYFDTYEDTLLVVRINGDKDAHYTIMGQDGMISSEWTMPVISNYSEWVIPDVEWGSSETVFIPAPDEGGQLDELLSPYRLIRVIEGRQDVVADDITAGVLRCSPSGQKCLTGYSAEKLIDIKKKTQTTWLTFPE
ncbi:MULTISPECIES: hypothetical protein [Sporosarcina]|uniref:YqgU-like beta propeller domain-containing protein n=1 Tax=Sporosarcina TaxID=1569 RepID=UPI00164D3141|nr:hypothetical protein [Sporosarcina sp. resist]QNK86488.1 hypothetical protein H7992_14600 [Sporosarcina sp. resist]